LILGPGSTPMISSIRRGGGDHDKPAMVWPRQSSKG